MKRKWCNNGIDSKEAVILLMKIKCVFGEWMLLLVHAQHFVNSDRKMCMSLVAINLWHSYSCFADIKRATSVALTKIVAWSFYFFRKRFFFAMNSAANQIFALNFALCSMLTVHNQHNHKIVFFPLAMNPLSFWSCVWYLHSRQNQK